MELLRALNDLKDMRRGSIVGATFRCRKPNCHCSRPDDPGHGPIMRLTYKMHGKTVTEALPTPAPCARQNRKSPSSAITKGSARNWSRSVSRSAAYARSKKL
jgi:hypothetical protein